MTDISPFFPPLTTERMRRIAERNASIVKALQDGEGKVTFCGGPLKSREEDALGVEEYIRRITEENEALAASSAETNQMDSD